jgi:hypothetical protein
VTAVLAAGDDALAIGGERDTPDPSVVSLELGGWLAVERPQPDDAVLAAGDVMTPASG